MQNQLSSIINSIQAQYLAAENSIDRYNFLSDIQEQIDHLKYIGTELATVSNHSSDKLTRLIGILILIGGFERNELYFINEDIKLDEVFEILELDAIDSVEFILLLSDITGTDFVKSNILHDETTVKDILEYL